MLEDPYDIVKELVKLLAPTLKNTAQRAFLGAELLEWERPLAKARRERTQFGGPKTLLANFNENRVAPMVLFIKKHISALIPAQRAMVGLKIWSWKSKIPRIPRNKELNRMEVPKLQCNQFSSIFS